MNDVKVITQTDYTAQLKEFYDITQEVVNQIQQGLRNKRELPQQAMQLKEQLRPLVQQIASNGELQTYNWIHLRSLIVISTRDMLCHIQKLYPYEKTGNNEGFEDELDIILQFLCVFEQKYASISARPPFTLQRICELLINPEKHYKSAKKLLFAMEKLVNVSA